MARNRWGATFLLQAVFTPFPLLFGRGQYLTNDERVNGKTLYLRGIR